MQKVLWAVRFIPASAGNTYYWKGRLPAAPVYPRWRGEHWVFDMGDGYKSGLSPLARGTPKGADEEEARARFIPAGAGNTNFLKPG